MAGKRDNTYWRGRLKRDHPEIFRHLKSGAIPNLRQARVEAGLIKLPTRVDALMRNWKAATTLEKAQFYAEARKLAGGPLVSSVAAGTMSPPAAAPAAVVPAKPYLPLTGADGMLTPATVALVQRHIATLALKPGQMMPVMGLSKLDGRLSGALSRTWRPTPEFLAGLERFLALFAP